MQSCETNVKTKRKRVSGLTDMLYMGIPAIYAIGAGSLHTDNEPLNLPEAMRRGLRQVQNLPVNNPYAKLLGAQFMMSFRQLV